MNPARLRRPDLPSGHPQNEPISTWADGWLVLECASHLGADYVVMTEAERAQLGLPASRAERVAEVRRREGRQ